MTTTAALAALLLPTLAVASEAPAERFEEEVVVNEVLLDALVTDSKGNVVIGLDKADFAVRENGEPVEITGVTFYSNRRFLETAEAARALGVDPDAVPVDRYFILFFDDQRRASLPLTIEQLKAGRYAADWIAESLAPNDWVAVVGWNVRLRVYQEFTRDREELVAAVKRAASSRDPVGEWPSRRDENEDGPSLLANLPSAKELKRSTGRIEKALQVTGEALAAIPGRKNLILFSAGFGELTTAGFVEPDMRFYPAMMRTLNDANVAVYSIDLLPAGFAPGLSNSLSRLSFDTNGRFFSNFVSVRTPLDRIADENNGYYLLSYRSARAAGKPGYQRVKVTVDNPELKVRARGGYRFGT